MPYTPMNRAEVEKFVAETETGLAAAKAAGLMADTPPEAIEMIRIGRTALALMDHIVAGPDKILRCAFCGEAFPEGTPTHKHESLVAHARVCECHPLGIENRRLKEQLACVPAVG